MNMTRLHIQTFVQVHNIHRIRRQHNREHYLATGRPTELYNYPPTGVHDYGMVPDPITLAHLETQVAPYCLDEYLTPETHFECQRLLTDSGYPTEFRFEDNHRAGYLFLRDTLIEYIQEGGNTISVLEPPLGAEHWILENAKHEAEEGGALVDLDIGLTDDESSIPFDENTISDGENIKEKENYLYSQSEDFQDDGFVLNI